MYAIMRAHKGGKIVAVARFNVREQDEALKWITAHFKRLKKLDCTKFAHGFLVSNETFSKHVLAEINAQLAEGEKIQIEGLKRPAAHGRMPAS